MVVSKLRIETNKWIRSQLEGKSYAVVLNLGCGSDRDKEGGYYSDYFRADKVLKLDKKRVSGVTFGVAEDLPYADQFVDFVFSNWVIYVTDLHKSIPEICRVIKPGGEVLISYSDPEFDKMKRVARHLDKVFITIARFGPVLYFGERAGVPDKNVEILYGKLKYAK